MKIYTSYFAKTKIIEKRGIVPINIALYPPRFFFGKSIRYVAPTRSILKDTRSDEEYIRRYRQEILAKLDVERLISDLEKMSDGKDVALLCYEKPGDLCHRHLLADYLNEKGYNVKELDGEYQQFNLFD